MARRFIVVEAEKIVIRALLVGLFVIVLGVAGATAQMSQNGVNRRTLHGLVTFYSAGMRVALRQRARPICERPPVPVRMKPMQP